MNNVDVTDNYRGLSSIFSTLFTCILNARLQKEEQAGFRRGYSTIDNAFILNSFVQKYLDKRRKVYVAFADYRKVFDSVNRSVLWKILCKNGIIGKMLVTLFLGRVLYFSIPHWNEHRLSIILLQISELTGLTVGLHTGKFKVLVFRNGGYLAAREKWFINNTSLKVEVEYTYLGIVLSTRLRHTCTQNYLATRAKTVFIRIDRSLKNVPNISLNVFS